MADKKSLVEEALLQMKNLEDVVTENAKGILASTMKEEISELVKESLKREINEQGEEETDVDIDSTDDIEDKDGFDIDLDMGDDDDSDVDDVMGMDLDADLEDEQPIDLTNASDEEILKVFKSMGDEDGIIVTKDDDQINLEDENEDVEYIIQMEGDEDETIMDEEWNEGEMEEGHGYDHYRGAEEDDAAHIRDLKNDMKYDKKYTEMEEGEDMSNEKLDALMQQMFQTEEMDEENMYEEDMYEGDETEEGEVVYEIEMDEDDDADDDDYDDTDTVSEGKMTISPVRGKLTKSSLSNKAKKMETKEGSMMTKPVVGKGVKTGSAKFEYKEGKKMETKEASIEPKGRAKGVGMNLSPKKFEYKEGKYGMNRGDKSKTHKGDEDYTTKKGDTLKRKAFEKEETTEAARTLSNGTRNYPMRKGLPKMKVKPNSALSEEVSQLREKNDEYRKALNIFREKLNEVAVFNSNLAYATRLFTEHTTTKQEKINILRRFDNVETLKESKSLYGSIKNELTSNNQSVVTESMSKIEKSPASGSSQTLIESKTYENPQFLRMKDIMSKIVK
jgi:hypothetical protein